MLAVVTRDNLERCDTRKRKVNWMAMNLFSTFLHRCTFAELIKSLMRWSDNKGMNDPWLGLSLNDVLCQGIFQDIFPAREPCSNFTSWMTLTDSRASQ